MGLIIFLVLDFVALMLVKNKHIVAILALLLLGGLVGAVYDFTPIVISACWNVIQMITSVIPIEYLIGIIVSIVIVRIIVKGVRNTIRKSKCEKLMKWLARVGVGKVDPSAGN